MNKILSFLLIFFSVSTVFGQNKRNGISYQALIVDTTVEQLPGFNNSNVPLVNTQICLSFSILDQNNNIEYTEYVRTSTDELGMVNEVIGNGQQISPNTWDQINWSSSSKSLKVDLDLEGNCSNFETISNEPLTAVPFALFSAYSDVPGVPGKSSYEICPVCFWEDDGVIQLSTYSNCNHMTLEEAKTKFKNIGVISESFVDFIDIEGKMKYPC